jgi:adenosine deaminase
VVDAPVDVQLLSKAELHCHIDGLLDPELLRDLSAGGHGLALSEEQLASVCPVASMDDWFGKYAPLVEPHLAPSERMLPLMVEYHLRRLQRQNVVYAELMVSRLLGVPATPEATVELFGELRTRVDRVRGPSMEVGLVVCIGRTTVERLQNQCKRIIPLARAGLICGVALAGDERKFRIKDLAPEVSRLRDEGLGIEIHAGELAGPESVEDALDHGAPDRLGHAVAAFSRPALVERLRACGVHVEFCPTSNLRLGVVGRIEDHPLAVAHRLGIPFSINTDDPGPFGCSLTSELTLIRDTFGFGVEDFASVFRNTMAARFIGGRRQVG